MIKSITQETFVPVGLAVVVIGTVAGWATTVTTQIHSNEQMIGQLRETSESKLKLIYEINSRLSRIEWALENKKGERYGNR